MTLRILLALVLGGTKAWAAGTVGNVGPCNHSIFKAKELEKKAALQDSRFRYSLESQRYQEGQQALDRARRLLVESNFALQQVAFDRSANCQGTNKLAQKLMEQNNRRLNLISCHNSVTEANLAYIGLKKENKIDQRKRYIAALENVLANNHCQSTIKKQAKNTMNRYLKL